MCPDSVFYIRWHKAGKNTKTDLKALGSLLFLSTIQPIFTNGARFKDFLYLSKLDGVKGFYRSGPG